MNESYLFLAHYILEGLLNVSFLAKLFNNNNTKKSSTQHFVFYFLTSCQLNGFYTFSTFSQHKKKRKKTKKPFVEDRSRKKSIFVSEWEEKKESGKKRRGEEDKKK